MKKNLNENQGCQKLKKIPKGNKIFQMIIIYTKCSQNIPKWSYTYQKAKKYSKIFHGTVFHNLSKLGFLE
jgi:hypothetical protein